MTDWLISIIKNVAMGAAVWLLWSLRGAFVAGWNVQKFIRQFEEHKRQSDEEIDGLKLRMDRAGVAMSDLATDVQGLPERLRVEFLPRRESELIQKESEVDRERLWQEVRDLWKVVNRREEEKGRRR